ncbi:MAG: sigma 54-interacting transcriptional regulator [Proteobacteria bacterium]|nr:sigma 54-interacting transcriptional regulator [Pseudomonadota bacterium]
MPSLIIDKNQKGYKVVNFENAISMGRDPDNDVIIEDSSISRNHASIKRVGAEFILYDSSSNGTFVNDERILEYKLTHSDVFRIMDYNFSFIEDHDADTITLKDEAQNRKKIHIKEQALDKTTSLVFDESMEEQQNKKKQLRDTLKRYGIIAKNDAMVTLYMDIMELARINVPVLITGEAGTGKEKVADALHVFSEVQGDLVPLNCASIPEGIFESELFGSVKGAFSQAGDKPGKLEQAHNGTIFLDEIGDMALSIQPKLLRFLEDKKVTRLGDTKTKTINVRVVAATNQDLESMIETKKFRDDLYQRLACIKLKIPPLRERKEDIFPLAEFFLKKFTKEYNINKQRLSDNAKKLMSSHSWPGNVRELRNVLLRAAIKNSKNLIEPNHLAEASEKIKTKEAPSLESFLSLDDMEKKHIVAALEKAEGNKVMASKLLGISRDTLYKKIEKYNI